MPPSDVTAGSILVELKAQYTDLKKGVDAAQRTVEGFGTSTQATAKKVDASGKEISSSFDAMDKKSVQLTAKIARMTGILFTAQTVFEQFAGTGKNKGVAAASAGLSTFAAVALAFPNPVGLAIGAIAALGTGFAAFVKQSADAITAGEEINKQMAEIAQKKRDLKAEDLFLSSTLTGPERDVARFNVQLREREEFIKKLASELQKLKDAESKGVVLEGQGSSANQLDAIVRFQEALDKRVQEFTDKRRAVAIAEGRKDREALATENRVTIEQTKTLIAQGLADPIELVAAEAAAANAALKQLFAQQVALEKIAPGLGAAVGTEIPDAIRKAQAKKAELQSQQAVQGLANDFGNSVSRSLTDAILNQKDPMTALADLGGSLFENALNDAMKQVSSGLSAAFAGIAGGSQIIGGALSAGLGIAGGLFARRQSKSEESFSAVRSLVTSSQANRGIVAGPSSVAIAQVGEDLSRAMAPVVERLDLIARFTSETASNTRGGRGAGGGAGLEAVFVPTA